MLPPTIIDLPDKALPDIKTLVALDEQLFASLLAAISQCGPSLTSANFHARIAEKAPSVDKATIAGIIRLTFSLYSAMQKAKTVMTPEAVAEGVVNSPLMAKNKDILPEHKLVLSKRITQLLGTNKAIAVTSKAFDVLTEHDHIFCKARILSDIRPVFADNPETAEAAVIIHNLQIGFHVNGNHQEFYVALDTDDILRLKAVIERAEKKTIALRSILKQAQLPYLEK